MLELKNKKVILRDFIQSDTEDRIYWETVETEWQLWDAPWENELTLSICILEMKAIGIDIPDQAARRKGSWFDPKDRS